jgi:hypothetical protein
LATYQETASYLRKVAKASPRVQVEELGTTVEGRPLLAAIVSSPENLARLAAIRQGWAQLADPRNLSPGQREQLERDLPAGLLITTGIHSTEVAGPQTALLFLHQLANAPEASPLASWLGQVVVLLVPSLNPDGQEMVVAWYQKYLGTAYEGSLPPFLYHRYAGHDNNRDFVFLTQPESQALNRFVYHRWHPQLFVDLHQMGPLGPRQFVPPFADPINPTLPPILWRLTSHLGTLMAWRLEGAGKSGVVSGWTFDGHWIGGTRNTAWWKNVVGVLTETAGAALATPLSLDEGDLRGGAKGLWEYQPQVNFPNPWRGGKWGLEEAVSYQLAIMQAALEFAATYRRDLLHQTSRMAWEACHANDGPWGWAVPPGGDPWRRQRLVNLLLQAGAEAYLLPQGFSGQKLVLPPGTVVFPRRQPLGRFLQEVLEPHSYPQVLPAPGADILVPYDVTAWHLPSMVGQEVEVLEQEPQAPKEKLASLDLGFAGPMSAQVVAIPAHQWALHPIANAALAKGLAPCRTSHGWPPKLAAGSLVLQGSSQVLASLLAGQPVEPVPLPQVPPQCVPLRALRVGVFHPFSPVEDAGWLRWVLEQGGFAPQVITPAQVAEGVPQELQVLLLPDLDGNRLENGPPPGLVPLPPEFRLGLGRGGGNKLRDFVEKGGTLLAFARAAEWVGEVLGLGVSNSLKGLDRQEFLSPGELLKLELAPESPYTWGLPPQVAAMVVGSVAFASRPTTPGIRQVVARFPEGPLLLSGFLRGEEKLRRKAALLVYQVGQGRVVLFSFAPHFRGQTANLFPLIYNALWEAGSPMEGQPSGSQGNLKSE